MRNPCRKYLTLLLALAVACLPLQAFACSMDMSQHQDHAAMHADQSAELASQCCKTDTGDTTGDCALFMHCGSCAASAVMIFPLTQAPFACLQTNLLESGSGEITPSYSSPPYHPPNFS